MDGGYPFDVGRIEGFGCHCGWRTTFRDMHLDPTRSMDRGFGLVPCQILGGRSSVTRSMSHDPDRIGEKADASGDGAE